MTAIDPSLLLSSVQSSDVKKTSQSNDYLGKDAFLQILITQMQNQDPTNPMKDTEFISQMAQFTSLEQMQNLNTSFASLLAVQEKNNMMAYGQFIDKEISWSKVVDEIATQGTGIVKSVSFKDGSASIELEDGTVLSPGEITKLSRVSLTE